MQQIRCDHWLNAILVSFIARAERARKAGFPHAFPILSRVPPQLQAPLSSLSDPIISLFTTP
jgi:hypothetical protein